MRKKHWKHVTEKDFKFIKTLLSNGIQGSKVCEIAERGAGTIQLVKTSDDYAEFKRKTREHWQKYMPAYRRKNTLSATPDAKVAPVEAVSTEDATSVLKEIRDALRELVQAWKEEPRKKGIFG